MVKKKNRNLGPRIKRMTQRERLSSARAWLPKFDGKDILCGYRKRYGVDWRCAVIELEMLGVKLDQERVRTLFCSVQGQIRARAIKKAKEEEALLEGYGVDFDDDFSYIAGFTSGGAAYGVPWEEPRLSSMPL